MSKKNITPIASVESTTPKMQFFLDFLNSAGLSQVAAADLISISRPALTGWSRQDDTRLSNIFKVVDTAGYTLDINLTREGEEASGMKSFDISDFIVLDKNQYKAPRLTFLALALKRYGMSKTELAESLGLGYTAVRYWFSTDDISVSRLYDAAKALNASITYTFKKNIRPAERPGKGVRYCTTIIETCKVVEM